jgi:hypothetical protein
MVSFPKLITGNLIAEFVQPAGSGLGRSLSDQMDVQNSFCTYIWHPVQQTGWFFMNTFMNTIMNTSMNTFMNRIVNTGMNRTMNTPVNDIVNGIMNTIVNAAMDTFGDAAVSAVVDALMRAIAG